jgi:microcystin-dependent protein
MFGALGDIRYYNQPQWLEFIQDFRGDGYVKSSGSELAVVQHTPALMGVDIGTGEAWIKGCWCSNTPLIMIAIPAADATFPRIDRVVLRNYIVGRRTIEAVVIEGEPAAVPVAPAVTRTSDTYDIVLADIAVAAGATSILTANITDQRADPTLCGISSPLRVRVADIVTGTPLSMLGFLLDGVSTPSTDNDGVPLSYLQSRALTYPTGIPFWYAGVTVPTGYLECIGQSLLRASYPELFALIGTTFGSIDGTHFNLPDGRGRCIFGYDSTQTEFNAIGKTGGEETHALTSGENPAHTHTMAGAAATTAPSGGYYLSQNIANQATGNTGGGLGHNNLQPYITMKLIVRGA